MNKISKQEKIELFAKSCESYLSKHHSNLNTCVDPFGNGFVVVYILLSFYSYDSFCEISIPRDKAVLLVKNSNKFDKYMKKKMKRAFTTFEDRLKELYYDKVKSNGFGSMKPVKTKQK